MILGIGQHKLLIAIIIQSETPAISQAAHSKSISNTKSNGTYQPIMSNPVISMLISKRHVIWWVRPILQYSRPLPSDQSMCFLWLSWHSFLPIFFVLAFEGLATLGQPCGQVSWMDPWHMWWLHPFLTSCCIVQETLPCHKFTLHTRCSHGCSRCWQEHSPSLGVRRWRCWYQVVATWSWH